MTTHPSFHNKVAVVTGAAGTLCSALAASLAGRGCRVALLGRTLEGLERVAEGIASSGGTARPVVCDVTSLESVAAAHQTVAANFGGCDFLINGAGGNQAGAITTPTEFHPSELEKGSTAGGFFGIDLPTFESVLVTNTMGTVLPCRVFGRDMAARGSGNILNFASMNSYRPLSRVAAYAMSKAAVVNFTQWLAAYLAPAGVRVNAIAPGFFLNDRSRKILLDGEGGLSERGKRIMSHTPLRRFGEAEELLGTALWLLDDEASGFVTGQTIAVDGGFLASPGV